MDALGAEGRRFKSCLPDHKSAVSQGLGARCRGTKRENASRTGAASHGILTEIKPVPKDGLLELIAPSVLERFWSMVAKAGPDDCWDWQASLTTSGYGRFKIVSYRQVQAHRVALIADSGVEHPRLLALHSCDRPKCCNPKHLRWGTVKDNSDDKVARNRCRNGNLSGFDNPRCSITPEQLENVVRAIDGRWLNNKEIAARFGMHHSMVSKIRTGNAWVKEAAAIRLAEIERLSA